MRPPLEHHEGAVGVALRQPLAALRAMAAEAPEPGWWYWVVGVDPTGRIIVPARAWPSHGRAGLCAVSRGDALVLREGTGAAVGVDRRGRLTLPPWLRSACGPGGSVLVAARRPDAAVVVVSPVSVLDALVAGLVGEVS